MLPGWILFLVDVLCSGASKTTLVILNAQGDTLMSAASRGTNHWVRTATCCVLGNAEL